MTSRLGTREQRDAEHRAAHPYDLILRLEGSTGDWSFGRFKTAERARAIGQDAMRERRRSHLPHGRVCRGYRVIDTRTNEDVTEQLAQAA